MVEHCSIEIDCDGKACLLKNHVVYPEKIGSGDVHVGILGEAPYVDEVLEKRPFIGASGKVIRRYCDFEGCTYFIFNTVSCLTYDGEATVKPSQMGYADYQARFNECRAHREAILDQLDTGSVVVAFGKFAIAALFPEDPTKKASSEVEFLKYKDKVFMAYRCYHPAYLLYRPSMLGAFEEILKATGVFRVRERHEL